MNMYVSERTEADLLRARKRGRPAHCPAGQRADRREDIVQAASKLFLHEGYAEATLRRVAADAQVNVALIHYYFTNKQGLYLDVLTGALDQTLSGLRHYQQQQPTIYHLIHILTEPLLASPALAHRLLSPTGPNDGVEMVAKVSRRIRMLLRSVLQTMQRTGRLRDDLDAELLTAMFLDLFWGPIRLQFDQSNDALASQGPTMQRQIEQNTKVLEAAILRH
jgi:AcrR family transcriptional regulator